ncbi:hypothetical protein RA307_15150 [Xanthobacteraceae bacterium Astr-EGSB]|uniref:hypothetical protein n=1 Tax=Astrobacterium formosum TaxID=3069710 RepID=UPI0027B290C1|nr:hypothetical protein [Xanthobacteraceae bacterium Astr-EGSB]
MMKFHSDQRHEDRAAGSQGLANEAARRRPRWKRMVGISVLLAALVFAYLIVGDDAPTGMEVFAEPAMGFRQGTLRIRNAGSEPIRVIDIHFNDRADCTQTSIFVASNETPPNDIPDELRHKYWVATSVRMRDLSDSLAAEMNRIANAGPKPIRTGEFDIWWPTCGADIIRALVKTDKGAWTYTFK